MAIYHILNGDNLAETFRQSTIDGDIIVVRECLIDGPVSSSDPETFWQQRSDFIQSEFNANTDEYFQKVKSEFDKLDGIDPGDEIDLWFENDLFCQANMWFTISLINKLALTNVFRVSPLNQSPDKWSGFGNHAPSDLVECYRNRQPFTKGDFTLGENLWNAYRNEDVVALAFLGGSPSTCFPSLEEVCKAEIERKRNSRPLKVLEQLLASGHTGFNDIFKKFSNSEGIYGYGDLQVQKMLKDLKNS